MNIVTWNVNSLKARAEYVEWYLDSASPDVLCLQELKLEDAFVPRALFESRGYHVETHGQKQWNGVLIASKEAITDVHCGLPGGDEGQSRLIAATTYGVRLINLYCPQGQAADSPKFKYKLGFYAALRAFVAEHHSPEDDLIVLGDLNVAPHPEDVYSVEAMENVPTYHPREHEEWQKLVSFGLHDAVRPHIEPGQFSFWDYRGGAFRFNRGFRIDHILATQTVQKRVTGAWIDRNARKKQGDLKASDHAPVGIVLD